MTMYKKLWAGLVFLAGLLELIGLKRRAKGDTLSEYTWSKTRHPVVSGAVVGLVGWLVYHFSVGRGEPLGYWDAASAGVGIVLGVLAARKRDQ